MTARLMVVGGGKMGSALVSGLLSSGWCEAPDVVVVEAFAARRDELGAELPGVKVTEAPVDAQGTILAVKPGDVSAAAGAISDVETGPVLSIAAGITTASLEAALPVGTRVVRAMPNTPALVQAGASAICAGTTAGDDDLDWAQGILSSVGTVARVPETAMDAVTGLSGSGPAYVFLVAEALIEAGVLNGLPRPVATQLAEQTLLGAATLLTTSDDGPEGLRAAVTSPGGTTAVGLHALESAGVRAAFLDAVTVATERSRQLGS